MIARIPGCCNRDFRLPGPKKSNRNQLEYWHIRGNRDCNRDFWVLGRVRIILARMWHVMVPKVPLGYWLMVGYHMSGSLSILLHVCHPSLPLVSLRRVAREHKRVGSQTHVAY